MKTPPPPTLWEPLAKTGALATSAVQGERIRSTCPQRRYAILCFLLGQVRSYTADEISAACNWTMLGGRPRVSELVKAGWVVDVGTRRKTEWGGTAAGLQISGKGVLALEAAQRTANPVATLNAMYLDARARR